MKLLNSTFDVCVPFDTTILEVSLVYNEGWCVVARVNERKYKMATYPIKEAAQQDLMNLLTYSNEYQNAFGRLPPYYIFGKVEVETSDS